MNLEQFLDILKETLILTAVVVGIMLLVDLIRAYAGNRLEGDIWKRKKWSVPLAALLGATPGCIGSYVSVSLYEKRVIPFGALMAMSVATMGDESFMMLAMFPKKALGIIAALTLAGITVGYVCIAFSRSTLEERPADKAERGHEHNGLKHDLMHALSVFAWAFSIMMIVNVAGMYIDLESVVAGKGVLLVAVAVLVGLIPSSGPHMIFVTLFAQGVIPLPVLLASCIAQEGHAGLPLIACDRRAFAWMKLIKCVLALAAGWIGLLFV